MQDYNALKEIEAYGEPVKNSAENLKEAPEESFKDSGNDDELFEDKAEGERKYSLLPLFQVACCALILLTLLYLKMNNPDIYSDAVSWYQQNISEEIELPRFVEKAGEESSVEEPRPQSFKDLDSAEGHNV